MLYGPIFRKYIKISGKQDFSSNRLSGLTQDEIIEMCHILYQRYPDKLNCYYRNNISDLVQIIYEILRKTDL